MRTRFKLILFALVCSVLPLLGISTLAFDAARDSLRETFEHEFVSVAEQELSGVQQRLNEAAGHLVTWRALGIMQDVLIDDTGGDLQAELVRLGGRYPVFRELLVLNERGVAVAATSTDRIGARLHALSEFTASSDGVDFQGPVVSSNGLADEAIGLSVPIRASYDHSTIIGVLVGSVDWQYVKDELSKRKLFGGEQSQDRRLILQSSIDNSILYSTKDTTVSNTLIERLARNSGVRESMIDGSSYVVATVRSRPSEESRDPNWVMHVVIDADVAFASIEKLRHYLIVVGLSVIVLVTFLAYLLAGTLVRPIQALVVGAERLAAGEFDSRLPVTRSDEIGILARSFAAMSNTVKSKEEALIERTKVSEEAARLKGEFLANMSHEIRTPINGVLGMTELLLNTVLDDKQSRYASTILRSGQSLLGVINDVLDFSKIEAGKLELQNSAFDLRELVDDVVEMLAENAHRKGLELIVQLPPESHVAYQGDPSRLRQILVNLIGNAIKFTAEGEVRLRILSPETSAGVNLLEFEVSDTGIGIAPEAQASIFDSFVQADGSTTRKFGGTGLGLAISTRLVQLMHGEISVRSVPEEGSTFSFTARMTRLPATVQAAWQGSDAMRGKRILIVDDNRTNRDILEEQIAYWGAEHGAVSNGRDALRMLHGAVTQGQPFDLAILDMHMPGMDGIELTVAIKDDSEISAVRLCMLSSVCDQLDMESCRAIGIESYLAKPVRRPELYRCLTALTMLTPAEPIQKLKMTRIDSSVLSGRILLAEDHPVNQDMMCEMLRIMGLTVVAVSDGWQAVEALTTGQFDLVLMDCQMPTMDGFEATAEIRRLQRESVRPQRTPIIALTANAMQGDKEQCLASGMDDYLSKPVGSATLHETLKKWLGNRPEVQTLSHVPLIDKASVSTANPVVASERVTDTADREQAWTTAAASTADGPLDHSILASVLEMCAQATPGFFDQLVKKYEENSTDDLRRIENAFAADRTEDISKGAHRLKSSSASLGATRLASLCQELESAARIDQTDSCQPLIGEIGPERDRVLEALHSQQRRAA